ncbi:MAG: glycosyltransferase [Muribaculaceae bacterium]|nr:glycosyltransferase [Muribaculaceae bacterium]
MTFNFDLSALVIVLLSVSAIAAVIVLTCYVPFVRRVCLRAKQCILTVDSDQDAPSQWTAASIIVYSQGEADRLESLLPVVLHQDYDGPFEVIVVNEGDSPDVRNVISALQMSNRNLYLTFTPDGARSLSRKKLGLTLGIKAARYPVVVQTTTDAVINSDQWLTKILRHFNDPEVGIVLGYAAPSSDIAVSRRYSFDFTNDSVAWLSPAINHHPYRGSELNLAYRRELFFANKGFSRSLNLHFGDDDIFISEIADKTNTVVELSPESVIRFTSYDMASALRDAAIRHIFTSRFIRRKPVAWLSVGETMLWLSILSAGAAIALDYMNLTTILAALIIILVSFGFIASIWRKVTAALYMRIISFAAPWLVLAQPFRRLSLTLYAQVSKQKKYTWD